MTPRAQKFGGPWSILKVETVGAYLQAYCTALKNKPSPNNPFTRLYIDAFAGSGSFSFDTGGDAPLFDEESANEDHAGSAKRALQVTPPFDRLYFIELRRRNIKSLEELAESMSRRADCEILTGDSNDRVKEICAKISGSRNVRGVIFLDPFGMELEWETLKAIGATEVLDVWYLFPLGGVLRNAPHDIGAQNPNMVRVLDRGLGTDAWRQEFYKASTSREPTLFDQDPKGIIKRVINADGVEAFVKAQLEKVFPRVMKPRRLLGHKNSPAFSLFFALSNPNQKAWSVAERIAGHLLKPR